MNNKNRRLILAYHMSNGEREVLETAMKPLRIEICAVAEARELAPLGMVAGAEGAKIGGFAQPAGPLTEPMIVMCGLNSKDLDQVLPALRKAGLKISLKAMLTPTNMNWNGRQLQAALKQERAAFRR